MAFPRLRATRGPLTALRLLVVLLAVGATGLALATAQSTGDVVALIGAVTAACGCVAAAFGSLARHEDTVLYGSLPALVGSGLCGAYGLETFDLAVALGMTGAVLCSLALYELGTTAALFGNYLAGERPRERHDIGLIEEALGEHLRQVLSLLGVAFLLTMALLAGVLLLGPAPASPAVAAMFGALALTGAGAVYVLRGGSFSAASPPSTASPAGRPVSPPSPPAPRQGSGPGR